MSIIDNRKAFFDYSVEERYEEVRQLVALGREKGYLAYDEINEMLPEEVSSSPEEIDEGVARLSAAL